MIQKSLTLAKQPHILAIETSCDETAVAIFSPPRTVHCNLIHSQIALHRAYGGIVPELASRSHGERLADMIEQAWSATGLSLNDMSAIAATAGPGLLGALLVGLKTAQAMAMVKSVPFLAVNHLHGHLLSPDLDAPMQFPALVLLATGGHTALYYLADTQDIVLLKRTADDAVGEAFDKVAKLLGLPYPGGPEIEKIARQGNPLAIALPRPHPKDEQAFSLSGLKTAVRREIEQKTVWQPQWLADLAASFQGAIADVLVHAIQTSLLQYPQTAAVYLVGGVARNQYIKQMLEQACAKQDKPMFAPSPVWCTDNAAMIARAAWVRYQQGQYDDLDLQPLSRSEIGRWVKVS